MSSIADTIQAKCLAFGDRIIKLNDYLLAQASLPKLEIGSQKADRRGKYQPLALSPHTSRVPVHLKSVATLSNQLLRSGTSIGANNAEATYQTWYDLSTSKTYFPFKREQSNLLYFAECEEPTPS